MKILLDGKVRKCVFCKYWYDPANLALEPAFGKGIWRVNSSIKNKCLLNNISKSAICASCHKFESKF